MVTIGRQQPTALKRIAIACRCRALRRGRRFSSRVRFLPTCRSSTSRRHARLVTALNRRIGVDRRGAAKLAFNTITNQGVLLNNPLNPARLSIRAEDLDCLPVPARFRYDRDLRRGPVSPVVFDIQTANYSADTDSECARAPSRWFPAGNFCVTGWKIRFVCRGGGRPCCGSRKGLHHFSPSPPHRIFKWAVAYGLGASRRIILSDASRNMARSAPLTRGLGEHRLPPLLRVARAPTSSRCAFRRWDLTHRQAVLANASLPITGPRLFLSRLSMKRTRYGPYVRFCFAKKDAASRHALELCRTLCTADQGTMVRGPGSPSNSFVVGNCRHLHCCPPSAKGRRSAPSTSTIGRTHGAGSARRGSHETLIKLSTTPFDANETWRQELPRGKSRVMIVVVPTLIFFCSSR